ATRERAREIARKKVRELAAGAGARLVSAVEASALDRLRRMIGARALSAAVEQLEDSVLRLGDWVHLGRAVDAYVRAGHGRVEARPLRAAVADFLAEHAARAPMYVAGLRKELEAACATLGDVAVCDLSAEMLRAWMGRRLADGSAPGPRFGNNRLGTWKRFLSWSRERGLLAGGEPHVLELVRPARLDDRAPPVWTPEQARAVLEVARAEMPEAVPYVVVGCWLGCRPSEILRLKWADFDWSRGYLNVAADVARKVRRERFVPVPDNARAMLEPLASGPLHRVRGRRGRGHLCGLHVQRELMVRLRAAGVLEVWQQDVMRHSYISYRLAQGHGRGQVAEWAGNSEGEILRSYRRPLRAEDGAAWFGVVV
ncbi:MAG TPA: hypothetical protein PLP58_22585, partial [Prosthecobacter sp.]|nr:hypothetical protein [Prosthecobacter sp.]